MARSFNGSTDQIDAPSSTPGSGASVGAQFSCSAWFNMSSLSPSYSAVYSRIEGTTRFSQIMVKSTGQIAYYVSRIAGTISVDPGLGTISTGSWHHVGFSYADAPDGMKTYLDGISDGTATGLGTLDGAFTTGAPTMGYDAVNAGRHLGGNIADVATWNKILTPSQFAALAAGVRPYRIQRANILSYWPLEGTASPEPDVINGNNGTLTGTSAATSQFVAARTFNGSTDRILLPAAVGTALGNSSTLSMWTISSGWSNSYNCIWGFGASSVKFYVRSTGKLALFVGGTTIYDSTGSITLSTGTWYNLAVAITDLGGGNSSYVVYVNDVADNTVTAVNPTWTVGSIYIGDDTAGGQSYTGTTADTACWNAALSTNEILQLTRGARPSSIRGGSLKGYWPLGLGSPEPDKSGAGNNGTLTGTTQVAGPINLIPVGA